MKKYLALSLVAVFFALACSSENADYAEKQSDDGEEVTQLATFAKVEISVPTIQCKTCVANVEAGIKEVDGIGEYKVDLDKKIAYVSYDESKTTLADIEKSIALEGYDANETTRDMDAYSDLDKCCQIPEDGGGH
ncbi:MAG: heavy-metal-associated domain-containing protein [bacterium]